MRGAKPFGDGGTHKSAAAGENSEEGFIKMLCSASPLVDTVMNSQAHCQGKLLHYTMAQWPLISLGGQHPGGSPDQRIYSGLEVPISLAIQSVQSPLSSSSLSLSTWYFHSLYYLIKVAQFLFFFSLCVINLINDIFTKDPSKIICIQIIAFFTYVLDLSSAVITLY